MMAKRKMVKFKISEISAVDKPAQKPARAVIIKRDVKESMSLQERVLQILKNNPELVANFGDNINGKEEDVMSDPNNAADQLAAKVSKLEKDLEIAKSYGQLNDAEKTHYDSLTDEKKTEFLSKSSKERQAVLESIAKADPIEYTSDSGVEYHKSDGEKMIALAKQADASARIAKAEAAKNKENELRKRAEETLSHLPGDKNVHLELIKSVENIEDEKMRSDVIACLKAQNSKMATSFVNKGTSEIPEFDATATQQLDELAKAYAAENKISYEQAYVKVLETEKGQDLYSKSLS